MSDFTADYGRLKTFLETHPACLEAARPLRGKACIRIVLLPDGGDCFYTIRNGHPVLDLERTHEPDVTIRVTSAAIDELLALPEQTIPAYALKLLQLLDTDDTARKIRSAVHAGIFRLWRHGYFSYFRMGGREFLDYLRRKGLGSLQAIQRQLKNTRTPPD